MASPKTEKTAEIVGTPSVEFEAYSPLNMQTWDEANVGALEFPGFDLLTDERTDALEGVPFLVVGATFRPGIVTPDGRSMAYVSVEALVAPANLIRSRGIDPESLPFRPESHIVFNDGSTGVYRQVTNALEGIGYIKLGEAGERSNARKGESTFDQPPAEWADVRFGEIRFDEEGRGIYYAPIRIRAPRGLRLSTYDNPYGTGKSTSRYIA